MTHKDVMFTLHNVLHYEILHQFDHNKNQLKLIPIFIYRQGKQFPSISFLS